MFENCRFWAWGLSENRNFLQCKIINKPKNPKKAGVVEMGNRGRPRKENTPLREYWRWLNDRRKQRAEKIV